MPMARCPDADGVEKPKNAHRKNLTIDHMTSCSPKGKHKKVTAFIKKNPRDLRNFRRQAFCGARNHERMHACRTDVQSSTNIKKTYIHIYIYIQIFIFIEL